MNPQYSMILIKLIAVACVGFGLCVWKFLLKKKINLLFLLVIISFLPLISMLRPGPYESGDLALHAMRAMPFYESITQFHQLPKWAAELHLGYGDTYFEFLYVMPYVMISLFHSVGISFIDSTKLLFATTYIASGLFMYMWIKQKFGVKAGFISALFYLFAPYHLVDMHFRATIAESSSFMYLPLLLWIVDRALATQKKVFYVLFSLCYASLLLTHSVMFVGFSVLLCVYIFVEWLKTVRRKRTLVGFVAAMVVSLALTTFYWLPIFAESRFIYQSLESHVQFEPWWMYLVSPWRFGFLFQGHNGELSFVIGYTQLLVLLLAGYVAVKRRFLPKEKSLVTLCLAAVGVCLVMMQSFSYPLWNVLPLIKNFQFAYRLLVLVVFCISALAGITLLKIKHTNIVVLICIVTVLYTMLNWGNRRTIPSVTDYVLHQQLLNGPSLVAWFEPTAPIWVNRDDTTLLERAKAPLQVVFGNAEIEVVRRTAIDHEYRVNATESTLLRESTFYFPGWKVYVDGQEVPLLYDRETYSGVMHFWIEPGTHTVRAVFEDSPIRLAAKQISIVALGLCAIALCAAYTRSRPRIN